MTNTHTRKINIVLTGHVDHGKSTVLGRLLADTDALPEGKLDRVKNMCQRNSKPFEYAFLIDALKDEQTQGITIDSARVFYKQGGQEYLFIDAPGHIEFLKNMVTGASRADAAFLVIDAKEGVRENSKRHGYLLSMLGIRQVAVIVNKMDLAGYDQGRFDQIAKEYSSFLDRIGIVPVSFIPVSGREGDNIAMRGDNMSWYGGRTVMEALDMFSSEEQLLEKPFRMPVQDIYKFTKFDDDRRIVVGTVASGKMKVGDEIVFYPSGKRSTVEAIEVFNGKKPTGSFSGQAVGFTLREQIYVKRGEIASICGEERPKVTSRVKASLFWLGRNDMVSGKDYMFKLGTSKVRARLEKIERVFDTTVLESDLPGEMIKRNTFAECVLKTERPIAFDLVGDLQQTSRFVIVDGYDISGGGIIRQALKDRQSWVRDKVFIRENKWEKSMIPYAERVKKYSQQSALILITGKKDAGKKNIARKLEAKLFRQGKLVYFLGIGNVLYGVDADIKGVNDTRQEHLRRLAEVSHILLDAGMILIVTAINLTQEDLELIKTAAGSAHNGVVWVGNEVTTDIDYDIKIDTPRDVDGAADAIERHINRLFDRNRIDKRRGS
ncbi:MAG: adenylyl-sulfate kinase [Candidatus Omnitrophica bacterium]|nr:adenylyl-sulfate kinase [Candidatus Omnitrophota bacterium]